MKLKILVIGDIADTRYLIKKFVKNFDIDIIDFPKKGVDIIKDSKEGIEYFDSLLISKQVKKIRDIKDNYDFVLALPWTGARIAYLAGANYVLYFVGNDITTPPFDKLNKNFNYFEKMFYKKVLEHAIVCIGPTKHLYEPLKKYRKDAVRFDRVFVNTDLFNENIKPLQLNKKIFTFLSAQRIGVEKGIDKLWKAIELCKTDFEILQIQWFIEKTTVENFSELDLKNKKLLEERPKNIQFIPLMNRENLAKYFASVDAVIGQMNDGILSGIEREAVYCKKPVICFIDDKKPYLLDGESVIPPFLPLSNEPQEIANLIDMIVQSKEFREELAEKEYSFVKKLCDPQLVANDWEKMLIYAYKKSKEQKNKSIFDEILIKTVLTLEKLYIRKFKEKNIKTWGKIEYEKLTKT